MQAIKITFDKQYAYLHTESGKIGRLPLSCSPRLARATDEERNDYRFMRNGVHWNAIDEDIRFETFFEFPPESTADKLGAVPDFLSISYLAQRFFGKSRSWLHNKLRGNLNNGKPNELTDKERKELKNALLTIADEIRLSAENL